MSRRGVAWVLVGGLVLAPPVQAVVFHDGVSNAQRVIEFVWAQGQGDPRITSSGWKRHWRMVEQV